MICARGDAEGKTPHLVLRSAVLAVAVDGLNQKSMQQAPHHFGGNHIKEDGKNTFEFIDR